MTRGGQVEVEIDGLSQGIVDTYRRVDGEAITLVYDGPDNRHTHPDPNRPGCYQPQQRSKPPLFRLLRNLGRQP